MREKRYPYVVWARLPEDAARQLQAMADADDRPVGQIAHRLLMKALEQEASKQGQSIGD